MINEKFIYEWLNYHKNQSKEKNIDIHWTDEYLLDLAFRENGDEELWSFVLKSYKIDMPERILAYIAAGPLEDLLTKNGEAYIDKVEILSQKDPKFKKLLGAVWQNSMSKTLWERVCAVKGTTW